MKHLIAAAVLCTTLIPCTAFAQHCQYGNISELQSVWIKYRSAALKEDAAAASSVMKFPFKLVSMYDEKETLKTISKKYFSENYHEIFVKNAPDRNTELWESLRKSTANSYLEGLRKSIDKDGCFVVNIQGTYIADLIFEKSHKGQWKAIAAFYADGDLDMLDFVAESASKIP